MGAEPFTAELTEAEARQALERFVVDNDDLLSLEERIGRFNIFDALDIARVEIRHSKFLAWLLDPAESHGQGSLFLKAVLMELPRQAPADLRPLSPIELDGEELRGVDVQTEWKNIDILVRCKQPPFVIAIENKVGAGEHSNQLQRYEDIVRAEFGEIRRMFVFLTADGAEPSGQDWVPYSFADLYRVLRRCTEANKGAIGGDVEAFLNHYLRLIGTRFMPDPDIEDLCKRIYKNHRRAIDLVVEHAATGSSELLAAVESALASQGDHWNIFNHTSRRIDFVPKSWMSWLPPIGTKYGIDKRLWLVLIFDTTDTNCRLHTELWRIDDLTLRFNIATRLSKDKDEFGLRVTFLKPTTRWNRLASTKIAEWSEDEKPEIDKVVATTLKRLNEIEHRFSKVPDALRPIFDEWKKSQPASDSQR